MSSPTESRNTEKQSEEVISSEAMMEVEETFNEVEPNKNAQVEQQDDPTASDEAAAAAAVKEATEEAEGFAANDATKENNTDKDEVPQVEQSLQHVLYPGGTCE